MNKLLLILLCFLVSACNSKLEESQLFGQWKTVSWVEAKTDKSFNNVMDFAFDPNMRYTVDYGSVEEKGSYWIEGNYLHTIEDGEAEKKVRILMLSADSLKIEMNRSGRIEHVSFVRQE